MQYIILAFRSRNQTAKMYQIFTSNGVPAKIVNTPKEANVGCGISLRFDEGHLSKAKQLVSRYPQNTYVGFFKVTSSGGVFLAKRLC